MTDSSDFSLPDYFSERKVPETERPEKKPEVRKYYKKGSQAWLDRMHECAKIASEYLTINDLRLCSPDTFNFLKNNGLYKELTSYYDSVRAEIGFDEVKTWNDFVIMFAKDIQGNRFHTLPEYLGKRPSLAKKIRKVTNVNSREREKLEVMIRYGAERELGGSRTPPDFNLSVTEAPTPCEKPNPIKSMDEKIRESLAVADKYLYLSDFREAELAHFKRLYRAGMNDKLTDMFQNKAVEKKHLTDKIAWSEIKRDFETGSIEELEDWLYYRRTFWRKIRKDKDAITKLNDLWNKVKSERG